MSRPSLSSLFLIPSISTIILSSLSAQAYIPAMPVNDTTALNLTDSSTISIAWQSPAGVYTGPVSYQLKADIPTNGTTSGALVHFTEAAMGKNLSTDTPWIAYISCEANETEASMEWDIFTLARDRGAVSALLYATYSVSCLLNREYIQDFEKPLDVFATKTNQVAKIIDSQWTHTNQSFYTYNGTLLNISGLDVNQSLAGEALTTQTYLLGTLTARNSTGQVSPTDIPSSSQPTSPSTGGTISASMIVLYTIVGVIGTLFITMLYLGWRRARRHPERYGRREESDGQAGQSTAVGLAQAILDTFPVIKFRGSGNRPTGGVSGDYDFAGTPPKRLQSEQNLQSIILPDLTREREREREHIPHSRQSMLTKSSGSFHSAQEGYDDISSSSKTHSRNQSRSRLSMNTGNGFGNGMDLHNRTLAEEGPGVGESQDAVGQDQCPICLLDFEEGDDLRVLPCEKEHSYHQTCIDPWLLQVSSSCPLCRKDFNNPSTTNLQDSSPQPSPTTATTTTPAQPPTTGGFARYLAFMRRERRGTGNRRRAETGASRRTNDSGGGGERERSVYSARHGEGEQGGPGGY